MISNTYYIVRHGESENNVLEIESSPMKNKDLHGLTEKGKKEVCEDAEQMPQVDFIFTSPFRRTRETAEIFHEYTGGELIEDERIREVDAGDFELLTYDFTDTFTNEHSEEVPYPNGESLLEARERSMDFYHDVNEKYTGKSILIVTHGYTVDTLLTHLTPGYSWEKYLETHNGARKVTRVEKTA